MLRHVLLQNVVLNRAAQLLGGHALLLGRGDVERPDDDRRPVDRHRRRHAVERNAVEQHLHVGHARDRDAGLADFAERTRMVGVVAHQRREVERGGEPRLTVLEQELEPRVRVARAAESGELAHRPQLAAVAGGMNAARERIGAGNAEAVRRSADRRRAPCRPPRPRARNSRTRCRAALPPRSAAAIRRPRRASDRAPLRRPLRGR